MDNKNSQKLASEFYCEKCNYRTVRKNDFEKHILTAKHQKITDDNINLANIANCNFKCDCGKEYNNRHNLSRHKKVCKIEKIEDVETIPLHNGANMNIIIDIIRENQEFKNMLIEQSKQTLELHKENNILLNKLAEKEAPITTINNTTNNNNNQQFNLNFFLNETCKDAMNIQEFIENIKITFEELLTIGNSGFVNGVSDIFLKRLKDLEITRRPIHCTDAKRETIYLKEYNTWEKDDKDNNKLKDVIEKVEKKNVVSLHQWCTENPDSKINNTPNNLLRDKIFMQTLQGDDKTREKIIKNISREVVIDKENALTLK
jgi:hypothetical protein